LYIATTLSKDARPAPGAPHIHKLRRGDIAKFTAREKTVDLVRYYVHVEARLSTQTFIQHDPARTAPAIEFTLAIHSRSGSVTRRVARQLI
jgi:hypothetical protein